MNWLSGIWKGFLGAVNRHPVLGVSGIFLAGVIFWGGFNWSLKLTNTEQFCISCHVMEKYVYKEYKTTIHYANRTGVRASCPDCHVPKEWIHMVLRKVAATNELFHWMAGSIDTPEKFEAKRLELARNVWDGMKETDSRECRNCHEIESMSAGQQTTKAYIMHGLGKSWGTTCIECHQGIVHSLPKGFDKEAVMDTLHDRMEREKVNCSACHEDITLPPPGQGWK
ncbi:MAG: NapC/NirT family cytochrome c [Proteobacteria bacterium]|nr:NapC/NirT family cytochrome c [Pseudomonadota bacterium]